MSDEQQQQQQQRQQQMQQQHKSAKDIAPSNAGTTPPRKTNIHELRNQDYVSRLMAATPPYLYSAPVGPNNFFFSDMLRSLVQARNNENARNLQLQQSVLSRRPRKRSWSQHRPYYEHLRERKEIDEKPQLLVNTSPPAMSAEKPLELTNKPYFHIANKYRKADEPIKELVSKLPSVVAAKSEFEQCTTPSIPNESSGGAVDTVLQDTPPAASLPPQDLVLPPPPPVWYPPLYPPYGIDPLHFFIDLRVSGHIYDRKKENVSPLTSADNSNPSNESDTSTTGIHSLPNKHRHGSAFTVPVPRSNEAKQQPANHPTDAINLTSSAAAAAAVGKFENYAKYYDLGEAKENQPMSKTASANYMLQHLPRLYSQFAARDLIASNVTDGSNNNFDTDNKSEPDCDGDSEDRISPDNCADSGRNRDEIDVEIIDSIKYRTDGESSRCTSPDEASVTQID